ncbi:uncharacterized protein LOC126842852 [Adelges cooleyi]|uniref:uncharacterized protein LOC126842852 n=1 Tax=Adelges cooleyi TaxID=133065 RepID=UPI00217F3FED|nr:uncharacterized protein LOC126842852 [Adelges cooleyi]XP_050436002.1 uncharacterized protein LOC126842852 [Adelges cooleyi]
MSGGQMCRVCGRGFLNPLDVVNIFCPEGKKDCIAAKIFYTLTIIVTEDDPTPKHICKICFGHIDFFTRFANTCRVTNISIVNNHLKNNVTYREEMTRFLSVPVDNLCYKQNSDVKGIYDMFVKVMKSPSPVKDKQNAPVISQKLPIKQNAHNIVNNNNNVNTKEAPHKENSSKDQPGMPSLVVLQQPLNGPTAKSNNEIICLDDDDDNDDVQVIENVNARSNIVKKRNATVVLQKRTGQPLTTPISKINYVQLRNIRQVTSIDSHGTSNVPPRNSIGTFSLAQPPNNSEQMIITPDIPALPSTESTSFDSNSDHCYAVSDVDTNKSVGSSVTPETGFHFLFSSDQTVDLTSIDTSPKKKLKKVINQRKVNNSRKLVKISSVPVQDIMVPTVQIEQPPLMNGSRPKRTQTVAASTEVKKSKKSTSEQTDGINQRQCSIQLLPLEISLYQCPLCEKYFSCVKSRQQHECKCHSSPPPQPSSTEVCEKLDSPTREKTHSTSQQEFLTKLNLVKRVSINLPKHFAKRKHLQKALALCGNVLGKYKCHYCRYETSRPYILWAHMYVNHVQFASDTRSNSFCFVCNRSFGKRTKLLKHLDKCVENHQEIECIDNPCDATLSCDYSDANINSLQELEDKLWTLVDV